MGTSETYGKIGNDMLVSEIRSRIKARDHDAEIRAFQRTFGVFGDVERRMFSHSVSEIRVAGEQNTGTNDGTIQIIGHAAVFGKPSCEMSSPFGTFTEYIDSRAFDKVLLTNPSVILDWDHDTRYILGTTDNNTLELSVDPTGLKYWSRVAPTSYAADLKILMDGGYLNQSSFMFRVAPGGEEWTITEDARGQEVVTRTILEVGELFDVCVCVAGAYGATDSGIARTLAFDYAVDLGYIDKRKANPSRAKIKANTDEFRALGDVAWGPDEGFNELAEELEEALNADTMYYMFSVVDVAVALDKAIVVDWNDYTFWVVPFTVAGDEVLVSDWTTWVQVETAWVTTSEGYEANIRSAKIRREARMAEETEHVETPADIAAETVEHAADPAEDPANPLFDPAVEGEPEDAPEVTPEAAPEVTPEAEAEPEVETPDEDSRALDLKTRILAETRARLARASAV